MFSAGDVVLAQVQFTDTFDIKTRPAVVLFEEFGNVIAAGITSNISMKGVPLTKKEGAIKDSIIKTNYIFTISEDAIKKKLFSLTMEKRKEVYRDFIAKLSSFKSGKHQAMLVKKSSRRRHENSSKCIAYEYPTADDDINIAIVEIGGRYPEKGSAINGFKEIVFVSEGRGTVTIEKQEYKLEKEDAILIPSGAKYFFDGNMDIIVACSPAFSQEQHKIIEA